MSRETVLKGYVNSIKAAYDYVVIDCMPSLSVLTVNALVAADSVIIPVQSQFLAAKGMTQLVKIISKVKRQINPSLKIDGVLLTLVDGRTNLSKSTKEAIVNDYGKYLKIFDTQILFTAINIYLSHSIFRCIWFGLCGWRHVLTYLSPTFIAL